MNSHNWTTTFDRVNNTMTHTFTKQVKVVTSWADKQYYVTRNGETIDKGTLNISVSDYYKMLLKVEKGALELERLAI